MGAEGRRAEAAERARQAISQRSALHWAFYGRIFETLLRRDAHAVRVAAIPTPEVLRHPRLVVYSNHPSWWDPVMLVVLARRLLPGRRIFAPMDAEMIGRYGFMPRIGAFGVELGSVRGALDFMAVSRAALEGGDVLVVTAQGRFADGRERPITLAGGVARLADAGLGALFLPVALEYTFWTERRFEALARFGAPLASEALASLPRSERRPRLEAALQTAMDQLAADSIARDEGAFSNLLEGSAGINPVFDAWSRLKAYAGGRSYVPGHGSPAA